MSSALESRLRQEGRAEAQAQAQAQVQALKQGRAEAQAAAHKQIQALLQERDDLQVRTPATSPHKSALHNGLVCSLYSSSHPVTKRELGVLVCESQLAPTAFCVVTEQANDHTVYERKIE